MIWNLQHSFHLCIPLRILCDRLVLYFGLQYLRLYLHSTDFSITKSSTSCFQISFDYASLSLCQCSANPYFLQILNMCDYFNRCIEQSNKYTCWVTCLVSFFRILIANGVSVTLTTRCTSYFRSGSQLRYRSPPQVTLMHVARGNNI